MKTSQKVVISALGFLTATMVVLAAIGRVALSQSGSETMGVGASSTIVAGEQITETFKLGDFQGVEIEGAWQVRLTQGDEWHVAVSRSDEFTDDVNVYVRNNRLILARESYGGWRWWNRSTGRLSAEIVMPELNELDAAGAGSLEYYGTVSEEDVRIAGVARVRRMD